MDYRDADILQALDEAKGKTASYLSSAIVCGWGFLLYAEDIRKRLTTMHKRGLVANLASEGETLWVRTAKGGDAFDEWDEQFW